MATATKNKEVTVKAEVLETPDLETTIEYTLQKGNVTDKVIKELEKKHGGKKLKSLDDKEGYLDIKESRKEVRKVGIIAERICEGGRSEAVKIQKLWLSKQKEILEKIGKIQDPLDAEIKKFEDEEERIKQEEINRQEQAYMARQTTLLKMEAVFVNGSFTLGNVSYEINNIKEADQEIWEETILPKYQKEYEKLNAEKAEQERLKKEAEEKLRQEQEAFKQEQEQFRLQQEEFQRQQNELNQQRLESERLQREEQQRKDNEVRAANELIYKARQTELINLGLKYDGNYFSITSTGGRVAISVEEITSKDGTGWDLFVEQQKPLIEEAKSNIKLAEEQRLKDIKEQAAQSERERIEVENKVKEQNRILEEQRLKEEQAKASDKDKWVSVLATFNGIEFPEFNSGIYKGKLASLKRLLVQINEL